MASRRPRVTVSSTSPTEIDRKAVTISPIASTAVGALLDGAHIGHLVLDQNMSVLEGSLGMLPRRVLVAEDDVDAARRLLTDAGLGHELRPDGR